MAVNGEYLKNLRFADDVALFNEKTKQMEKHWNSLNSESLKVILKIHKGKTKHITKYADSEDILFDQEKNWKSDQTQIPKTSCTPQRYNKRRNLSQDQSSMDLHINKKKKKK